MEQRHELPRDGEAVLAFIGTQLATIDTSNQGKPSWTEINLFRTRGGSYVVQVIARTRRADWSELFSATAYASAEELLQKVRRSKAMMAVLDAAATVDRAISEALDDLENQIEEIR